MSCLDKSYDCDQLQITPRRDLLFDQEVSHKYHVLQYMIFSVVKYRFMDFVDKIC